MEVLTFPGLFQGTGGSDDVGTRPVAELAFEIEGVVLGGAGGEPVGEGTPVTAVQQKHLATHPGVLEHALEGLRRDRRGLQTSQPGVPKGKVQSVALVLEPVSGE